MEGMLAPRKYVEIYEWLPGVTKRKRDDSEIFRLPILSMISTWSVEAIEHEAEMCVCVWPLILMIITRVSLLKWIA